MTVQFGVKHPHFKSVQAIYYQNSVSKPRNKTLYSWKRLASRDRWTEFFCRYFLQIRMKKRWCEMLSGGDIPQANSPYVLVELCRHRRDFGATSWPSCLPDSRGRSYYTHAAKLLGLFDKNGALTDSALAFASNDAPHRKQIFSSASKATSVFDAWLEWADVEDLDELDPNSASEFLIQCSSLSPSTAKRRASTIKQWSRWSKMQVYEELTEAFEDALNGLDLSSRKSNKFDRPGEILGHQIGIDPGRLAIKALTAPKNYGNRISEATRHEPSVLVLVSDTTIDLEYLERAYAARALCHPPTLVAERAGDTWSIRGCLIEAGSSCSLFPESVVLREIEIEDAPRAPLEDIREAIESLLAIQSEASDDILGTIEGELRPSLRPFYRTKEISSSKQIGNRIGEALGKDPQLLVLIAPKSLQDSIEKEIESTNKNRDTSILLALEDGGVFDVVESSHNDALTEPDEPPRGEPTPTQPTLWDSRRTGVLDWRNATVEQWNRRLFDYVFADDGEDSEPVRRIAATTEELRNIVGAPDADPDEVAEQLAETFRNAVPRRTSMDSLLLASGESEHEHIPANFLLLWMTCFICWGYPNQNDGSFSDRLKEVLGRTTSYSKLEEAWLRLEKWLRNASGYRCLELPTTDNLRTVIGSSYFLAFPHGRDRNKLSRLLAEADLIGRQLPVTRVLALLLSNEDTFSRDFKKDLEEFQKKWEEGQDPALSPFWRAVQQEASNPSHEETKRNSGRARFVAMDEGDYLHLAVAYPNDVAPPEHMKLLEYAPLEDIGASLLIGCDGSEESAVQYAFDDLSILDGPSKAAVKQGLFLFEEVEDWEYRLVDGDASAADVVLLKKELEEPFRDAFGGSYEASILEGWLEVRGADIQPSKEPASKDLKNIDLLLITTRKPKVRFSGGVRIPGGHLWSRYTRPDIRANDAESVDVSCSGKTMTCQHLGDGIWSIPLGLVDEEMLPCRLEVEAFWKNIGEGTSEETSHSSRVSTKLFHHSPRWNYKPLPGKSCRYWLEDSNEMMRTVIGDQPILSRITTRLERESADLLEFDESQRFAGPGVGEFSIAPDADHDWMILGGLNHPSKVVFVGDPTSPTPSDHGYSDSKGDRRHWKACFKNAANASVKTEVGYEPLAQFPEVEEEFRRRCSKAKATKKPTPVRTILENDAYKDFARDRSLFHDSVKAHQVLPDLWKAIELVAALAANRKGISAKEFQKILLDLTKSDDFIFVNYVRRAWFEIGAIDVAKRQDRSNIVIVPRNPRLLLVKDGPAILGFVHGLVTETLHERLEQAAKTRQLEYSDKPGVCCWVPPLPMIRADDTEAFFSISNELDLANPTWVEWPSSGTPAYLEISNTTLRTTPPPVYKVDACWNWEKSRFDRFETRSDDGGVVIERRRHSMRPDVFVVDDGAGTIRWTYSRTWALLEAWKYREGSPFTKGAEGDLVSTGRDPAHLPLPIARICTILGSRCPGPTGSKEAPTYTYPLGKTLFDRITSIFPEHWLEGDTH